MNAAPLRGWSALIRQGMEDRVEDEVRAQKCFGSGFTVSLRLISCLCSQSRDDGFPADTSYGAVPDPSVEAIGRSPEGATISVNPCTLRICAVDPGVSVVWPTAFQISF